MRYLLYFFIFIFTVSSCKKDNSAPVEDGKLTITYIYIGGSTLTTTGSNENIPIDKLIEIRFDKPVNTTSAETNITLLDAGSNEINLTFTYFDENKLIKIDHPLLDENAVYLLVISSGLSGENKETFEGLSLSFTTLTSPLTLESVDIDGTLVNPQSRIKDISREPVINLHFNIPLLTNDVNDYSSFQQNGSAIAYTLTQVDEKTISLSPNLKLDGYKKYEFIIPSTIETRIGRPFEGLDLSFYTQIDSTLKFPEITDDELLTKIQQQTFKYFWDFGHPVSGLSRERITSGEIVTTGGSGFGVMSIIVGIERGFITRQEGVDRLETIVNFLAQNADRFHGAWPHWLNGTTGAVYPFSDNDDGADLVETAFMIQGLLTVRQYLNSSNSQELGIINTINSLWQAVEWDWFTQGGQDVLYWHWSPNVGWAMNMKITGWNEALVIYVLAASSTTHTISKDVYTKGWARDGSIINSNNYTYYGYTLPLRDDMGGPLFFAHYSFLGLDPRNLSDQYADYWEQNVTHTKINRAYCVDNPLKYVGYNEHCWGLTASDGFSGYSAHSPNNDKGVISPTAAISSLPYAPVESMEAIKHFYYLLGDKLWGEYGFYDAFDITNDWVADSYLAIDQGPIVVMIENYRTGLLWNLFMSAPEVQSGLTKLGFSY